MQKECKKELNDMGDVEEKKKYQSQPSFISQSMDARLGGLQCIQHHRSFTRLLHFQQWRLHNLPTSVVYFALNGIFLALIVLFNLSGGCYSRGLAICGFIIISLGIVIERELQPAYFHTKGASQRLSHAANRRSHSAGLSFSY